VLALPICYLCYLPPKHTHTHPHTHTHTYTVPYLLRVVASGGGRVYGHVGQRQSQQRGWSPTHTPHTHTTHTHTTHHTHTPPHKFFSFPISTLLHCLPTQASPWIGQAPFLFLTTHTHTHTHTHTSYTHTYNAYIYTYTLTHKHTRIHAHTHITLNA